MGSATESSSFHHSIFRGTLKWKGTVKFSWRFVLANVCWLQRVMPWYVWVSVNILVCQGLISCSDTVILQADSVLWEAQLFFFLSPSARILPLLPAKSLLVISWWILCLNHSQYMFLRCLKTALSEDSLLRDFCLVEEQTTKEFRWLPAKPCIKDLNLTLKKIKSFETITFQTRLVYYPRGLTEGCLSTCTAICQGKCSRNRSLLKDRAQLKTLFRASSLW